MWFQRQEDAAVKFELNQPGKYCFYPKCGYHLMYSFMNWLLTIFLQQHAINGHFIVKPNILT